MKLENLMNALMVLPPSPWRDAVLSALRTPGTSFEGSDGSGRTSRAQELLQIYRFRLEHIRKHRIEILGVEELVIALSLRAADARIRGESFVGPESVVHAFWDEDNKLVGCVMSNRHGMGEENFARAMD